jgi:Cys-tRNA(Pro)/Cys-tRNA(Cys) deacylase
MAAATRAIRALDQSGVAYREHRYEVTERVGDGYGEAVAEAIGLAPERVFKTLVAEVDAVPVVAVVPVHRRLSTRKLAEAAGGKKCALSAPADAERLTGYVTGGISPFGQRKALALYLDESAVAQPTIAVSGGRRGLQIELSTQDLLRITGGVLAPLAEG